MDYQKIYAIIDNQFIDNHYPLIKKLIKKKIYALQYREKQITSKNLNNAKKIMRICQRAKVPFIVNDYITLARRIKAHGIHLGQQDSCHLSIRKKINWKSPRLNKKPILGISCYDSLYLAHRAKKQQADYIALGCLFQSPTKPHKKIIQTQKIRAIKQQIKLPIVAIGGINKINWKKAQKSKANSFAMISGLKEL